MQETVSSSNEKYTLASFFAGVGGIELGFEQTGEFSTVYANEFDKNANITYKENFEDVLLDIRDVRNVDAKDIPSVDIITGGFPCQAFSIAGYRLGFEDERGDLFFDLLRIIKEKYPRVIFMENVKNMVRHDHGNTFKIIREALAINGYYISWKVLNGMEYGNIPQNRERIYIVGFRNVDDFNRFKFPKPIELTKTINDIIDFNNMKDEVFYYRDGKQVFYEKLEKSICSKNSIYQWRRKYVRENKSGVVPTLTANMGTGGHNVPIIYTDNGIRKLTPRETFNAQGYPKNYKLPKQMAKSNLYKQAGNSVVVPVIKRIADKILISIKGYDDKIEYNKPSELEKIAILKVDIKDKYEGRSFAVKYLKNNKELDVYLKNVNKDKIKVINSNEYLKIVNKGKTGKYIMVINI